VSTTIGRFPGKALPWMKATHQVEDEARLINQPSGGGSQGAPASVREVSASDRAAAGEGDRWEA
jgi:hypothetical protein